MTRVADDSDVVAQALAFAAPRLSGKVLADGESATRHAEGAVTILQACGAPASLRAAMTLATLAAIDADAAGDIERAFGAGVSSLVSGTLQLATLERAARAGAAAPGSGRPADKARAERVRRMLMAFSRDLRGVLLHLASRLQTLRWHARGGPPCPPALASEALELLAPLANRLGVWSLKWELEDQAFRVLHPHTHDDVARLLRDSRAQRSEGVEQLRQQVTARIHDAGMAAEVHGRAKHLYSIWRKMHSKNLPIERLFDLRALRVLVDDVPACYAALAVLHAHWSPVDGEYDDYIARPKPNGYQSLHTVVLDDGGHPAEVQIRTRAMHDHAEHGVAAHWAYKEAGSRGHAGAAAPAIDAQRVTQARKAMLSQMLAWEQDVAPAEGATAKAVPERVYVFTPQGEVVDLPAMSTAIDFAYALHTSLGHRCRGARLDGVQVPLNTPLKNGQAVEVTVAKDGGPSMDWLNPELDFLGSPRSRAKVRAWFNAQAHALTLAKGRERLERLLQRLGRTAVKHVEIAGRLQIPRVETLYIELGKDERPLRDIEALWDAPSTSAVDADEHVADHIARRALRRGDLGTSPGTRGDVLVVGVDSLMTALARCCRPAPPDAIGGFVTRTQGVAVHRARCTNYRHMSRQSPHRVCAVGWGASAVGSTSTYAIDVLVEALDRPGLLRDLSEVFAKERIDISSVSSQTVRNASERVAWMTFTVQLADTAVLSTVLGAAARVAGVRNARRK